MVAAVPSDRVTLLCTRRICVLLKVISVISGLDVGVSSGPVNLSNMNIISYRQRILISRRRLPLGDNLCSRRLRYALIDDFRRHRLRLQSYFLHERPVCVRQLEEHVWVWK